MPSLSGLSLLAGHGLFASAGAFYFGPRNSCSCLNWLETYESGKAKCGDALETLARARETGERRLARDPCEGAAAYSKQNDYYCAKVMQGSTLPDTPANFSEAAWCYVSSTCAQLGGGARVNADVSWKVCTRGQDNFLADLEPPDLIRLAKDNTQDVSTLVQMAYPVLKVVPFSEAREVFVGNEAQELALNPIFYWEAYGRTHVWPSVENAALGQSAVENATQQLAPEVRRAVEAVISSGQPTIMCETLPSPESASPCGQGEVFVIVRREVWRMKHWNCRTGDGYCMPYAS